MSVKKKNERFLSGVSMGCKKKAPAAQAGAPKKQGEFCSGLRQNVTEANISHREVCIPGLIRGDKPRCASQIGSLHYQQHGSVLRALPERLRPINRSFLNGAVVGVG